MNTRTRKKRNEVKKKDKVRRNREMKRRKRRGKESRWNRKWKVGHQLPSSKHRGKSRLERRGKPK